MKRENSFQSSLIKELKKIFPDCIVLKNDSSYIQGFPDLSIYVGDKWALLECKRSQNEIHQPNQDFYIQKANGMSYGSFIYPENKDEVIEELKAYFA